MRALGFTILFLLFCFRAFCCNSSKCKLANDIKKIDSLIYINKYEANFLLKKSLEYSKKEKLIKDYALILRNQKIRFAGFYNELGEWKKTLIELDSLLKDDSSIFKFDFFNPKIDLQIQWAIYYQHIGHYQTAIHLFQKSSRQIKQLTKDSTSCYNEFYNSWWLSNTYKKSGALEASIKENIRAIQLYKSYEKHLRLPSQIPFLSNLCLAIGDLSLIKNDTIKAFEYYQKSLYYLNKFKLKVKNPLVDPTSVIHNIKYSLIRYYNRIGQYNKSLQLLQEIKSEVNDQNPFKAKCHFGLGEVFVLQKKNDLALEHFHQAEKLFSNIYGSPNPYPAQANLKIAQIHEKQEQWESALLAYHKVLLNTIHNYKDNSIWNNPNKILAQGVYGKLELLTALQGKTRVYFALHRTKPNLNMLGKAQITSRLAIQLIDSIRSGLFLDTDRLFQTDQHYAVYEQAIEIAQELRRFAPEKEKELQGDIFRLIEKSKGLLLQAVFNRGMSENWNDPKLAQIQEEERQWKYILAQYEAKLQEEKDRIPANLQNEYLGRLHEFHNWMQKAKTTNPEYYQRKYEPQYITLQKFQQQTLQPQQTLIEYYWGERKLTTLVITQKQVRIYQQAINPVRDSLQRFQQLLTESASSPLKALRHRFNNLSHHLYRQLLATALRDLGSSYRQLSIVRDGPLEYLPFDLLDVAHDKSANEAISAQEFLVNRYPISYAHSATLLHEQKNVPILLNQRFFAAFAPSFPKQTSNNKIAMRLGNYNLPAAQAEACQLSKKIVGGRLYKDDQASERSFKLNASRYAIIHLPLHAFADDESPESSELLFTQPNPDSIDDGHFKAWELYGVQLKAQMVVLSACQTGRGKLQRGEGALSLAYAFFNAGVPCIVSSQWNAKDLPTSRIMENFYRYLKQGMPKAEALQKAKIKYLEQGDPHPFYWAHLIISGNEGSIKFPISSWFMRNQNHILIGFGLFVVLFVLILIFKGRFQR